MKSITLSAEVHKWPFNIQIIIFLYLREIKRKPKVSNEAWSYNVRMHHRIKGNGGEKPTKS